MGDVRAELLDYIMHLEIVDTHEHLPPTEEAREQDTDILKEYLTHYYNRDLISAGLKRDAFLKARDNRLPIIQRWEIVEPFWESCRDTGYGRALDFTVRGLYGIAGINRSTIEQLNELFLKTLTPGHFKKVLKEKSLISTSLLIDKDLVCDQFFFKSVYPLDTIIFPKDINDIRQVEQDTGIRICAIDDWFEACESLLNRALEKGAVAFKNALAYQRTLHYERVTRNEAEEDFNDVFRIKHFPDWEKAVFQVGKKFQDYMMHYILRLANRKNLTIQFHTGLHEGNGNLIYHSDPALLSNLFLEYPEVNFDLFHMGYPYQQTLSVLAKNFANVYIDMCWAHIVSPTASVNALIEWLDAVPINKISAFGGDYNFVDAVYGHQYLARLDVCKALVTKIEDGVFDLDRAKYIAEMIFYKNPVRLFRLSV